MAVDDQTGVGCLWLVVTNLTILIIINLHTLTSHTSSSAAAPCSEELIIIWFSNIKIAPSISQLSILSTSATLHCHWPATTHIRQYLHREEILF